MTFESLLFQGWPAIQRTCAVGVLAYTALVALLRISGKRTLATMNAFDWVVTVALGSTLATILLSKDVALAEGVTAFVTLIGLQYVVAWSCVRFPLIGKLVKSEPSLLVHHGEFCRDTMRRERVVEAEVLAAIREQGFTTPEAIESVILETDGTLSVVKQGKNPLST